MAMALRAGRLSLLSALSRDFAGRTQDVAIERAADRLADAAESGHATKSLEALVELAAACDDRARLVSRRAA